MANSSVIIFLTDSPSKLFLKGEILVGYFNPKSFFTEITYVLRERGPHDEIALKMFSGDASVKIHYFTLGKTLLKRPYLYSNKRLEKIVENLESEIGASRAAFIRGVNPFIESYIGSILAKKMKIPFIVSVHGTYDIAPILKRTPKDFLLRIVINRIARKTLKNSAMAIGVYSDATKYAWRHKASKVRTIYNKVLLPSSISYPNTEDNLKLIWVNRLEPLKDPRNILRAISSLQNVILTIIGSGTLDREVGEFIKKEKLENRVTWIKSMANAEIITEMQNSHIFIGNCNYPGITKGTIEAGLAGRVIILNRNKYASTEITDEWVQICEDSLEGYKSAICQFLNYPELMPRLFNKTQGFAFRKFHPNLIDEQWVDVYKRLGN